MCKLHLFLAIVHNCLHYIGGGPDGGVPSVGGGGIVPVGGGPATVKRDTHVSDFTHTRSFTYKKVN